MTTSKCILALIFQFCLTVLPAAGQTAMSTARGSVTDDQKAALPGATVTIRHVDTGVVRTAMTDDAGRYVVANLSPGKYDITAELQGFGTGKRLGVILQVGQEGTIDFALQIGTLEETITVSGKAALVETQNVVATHLDTGQIDALPTFGRDFASLALLAPGVVSTGNEFSGFSSNGAHQFQNNIVVDGASNIARFFGLQSDFYPQDWIQEFSVMSQGASAEFGEGSGGMLNVVTRSGSNDVTGRAYGYFQDARLNSAPYAGRYVDGQPLFLDEAAPYDQQRIGAFLGGPFMRDNLFYFAGFENLQNDQTRLLAVSPYWRTHGGANSGGPSGTTNGPNGSGFEDSIAAQAIQRTFLFKTDWSINDKHRATFRFNKTIKRDINCSGTSGEGCNSVPTAVLERSATFEGPIWSVMGQVSSTFGNSAFNEARAYYNVNKLYIIGNKAGGLYGKALIDSNQDGRYAQIGYPGLQIGTTTTNGLEGETNLYFIDNFTLVRGNHQLKFGGSVGFPQFLMDIDGSQKGRWTFSTDRVFDLNDPASHPNSFSGAVGYANYTQRLWTSGLFIQDSWQPRRNLTLNLGLRYDIDNTITIGNQYVDDYNSRIIARWGGSPVTTDSRNDFNNIAPRIGFVWVPTANRSTTVRGSMAVSYDTNKWNYAAVTINQVLLADKRIQYTATDPAQNPFCTTGVVTPACRDALRAFMAQAFPAFPNLNILQKELFAGNAADFEIPSTQQFSAGMTHSFGQNLSVQADYAYSRGVDVALSKDMNIQSVNCTTPTNCTVTTRDPRFTQINMQTNEGWSRYHALLTRVQWLGRNLRVGGTYTLSECTSNGRSSRVNASNATNPLDLSIDIGPCPEDRRHYVAVDASYLLPLDIQVSAIDRASSGLPYGVTNQAYVYTRVEPFGSRRGDSEHNLDLRLAKSFKWGSTMRVAAFWEMFNALNTRNFLQFQGNQLASNFGLPQGAQPMRRQQLGVKFDF